MNDKGTQFVNKVFTKTLSRSGVRHVRSLPYGPQANGQAEISNRVIKSILEKTVNAERKDWSLRLDEALWA